MNFRVIEGVHDDFSSIYDDFEKDYLDTVLTNEQIRKKYDLSKKRFYKLCRIVKTTRKLKRRPSNFKNYYKHDTGYYISKRRNGKHIYMGHVPTEDMAIDAVTICRDLNWDTERCRLAIWEMKQCQ